NPSLPFSRNNSHPSQILVCFKYLTDGKQVVASRSSPAAISNDESSVLSRPLIALSLIGMNSLHQRAFAVEDFDLDISLASGQAFRWQKLPEGWTGIIG